MDVNTLQPVPTGENKKEQEEEPAYIWQRLPRKKLWGMYFSSKRISSIAIKYLISSALIARPNGRERARATHTDG